MYIDCNPEAEIGAGGGCNDNADDCGDDDAYMQEEEEQHDSMEGVDTTCNRYVLYAAVSLCRYEMNLGNETHTHSLSLSLSDSLVTYSVHRSKLRRRWNRRVCILGSSQSDMGHISL